MTTGTEFPRRILPAAATPQRRQAGGRVATAMRYALGIRREHHGPWHALSNTLRDRSKCCQRQCASNTISFVLPSPMLAMRLFTRPVATTATHLARDAVKPRFLRAWNPVLRFHSVARRPTYPA